MRLLTLTEEEARSMQTIGTGRSWTVAIATLFVGALLNQGINMVLSGEALKQEFWIVLGALALGAAFCGTLSLVLRSSQRRMLSDIRNSTKQPVSR